MPGSRFVKVIVYVESSSNSTECVLPVGFVTAINSRTTVFDDFVAMKTNVDGPLPLVSSVKLEGCKGAVNKCERVKKLI